MYTAENYEQWLKNMNKNLGGPIGDTQKALADIWQRVAKENLEIMSDNLSLLSDQLKRFASIKRPEEYLNTLRECVNEDIKAGIENSQRFMHSTMENFEECMKSCGSLQENVIKTAAKEHEKHHHKEKDRS